MNKVSILVAEDDADDIFLMQTALNESGLTAKIEFVENGIALLNYLNKLTSEAHYPKFILLDLNMPKMDGREVLKKLKSSSEFKRIPIIIFSTTKNEQEVKRCYDLGANTYIVKPVSFDSLVKITREINSYWLNTAKLVDDF